MAAAQRAALPDVTADDVVGSAYCIRDYIVDAHLGGDAGLAVGPARAGRARGRRSVLDFVPNHVAPDHPWAASTPSTSSGGRPTTWPAIPTASSPSATPCIARGRDPYFPAWPEVLQLDASRADLRAAAGDGRAVDRRAVRRRPLRHGDAHARRRLRADVGRPGERAGRRPTAAAATGRR